MERPSEFLLIVWVSLAAMFIPITVSTILGNKVYIATLHDHSQQSGLSDVLHTVTNHRHLMIGKTKIIVFESNAEVAAWVSQHKSVRSVEEDVEMKLEMPVGSYSQQPSTYYLPKKNVATVFKDTNDCQSQSDLGLTGWGLIRTSHDELPDFATSDYVYGDVGQGVDVYVLDTGVDIEHSEFRQGRASHGFLATAVKDEGWHDLHSHGTHVAGIIAGEVYGIAKNTNIISCKMTNQLGVGSLLSTLESLEWIESRIQEKKNQSIQPRSVINISLGMAAMFDVLYLAIQSVVEQGAVVVVSAGNSYANADKLYPGAFNNTVTVAASNSLDAFATYSSYGPVIDFIAPGSDILSAGSSRSQTCLKPNDPDETCFIIKSGTSMAAPMVSGIVARYLSALSDEKATEVNQEFVKLRLKEMATEDMIEFGTEEQATTDNRLIYMGCPMSTETYSTTPQVNTGSSDTHSTRTYSMTTERTPEIRPTVATANPKTGPPNPSIGCKNTEGAFIIPLLFFISVGLTLNTY